MQNGPAPSVPAPAASSRPLRVLLLTAVFVYLPICIVMVTTQWIADRRGISLSMFTREPTTALGGKYWVGILSNLGVLMWCVTAAVCWFSAAVVRGTAQQAWRGFFIASGLLTTCLLIDDCFMLHDGMLWAIARVPEKAVIGAWGIGGLAWLVYYRRTILQKTNWLLLATACGFFAVSLVFDLEKLPIPENRRHLGEDGAKLLGIAGWGVYLVRTCLGVVRSTDAPARLETSL